jgi:hypothetical protein
MIGVEINVGVGYGDHEERNTKGGDENECDGEKNEQYQKARYNVLIIIEFGKVG